ncbi:polyribonucleotide nucleotidyltransferase [Candidatus Berkelbacteria bacterium]|nr:polyribonucleotide nucleotidyltransferase [Candidatus Berkelbacteria bacterium]
MTDRVTLPFGDGSLELKRDNMAKFASGSVLASWGGTVLLATTVIGKQPREGVDFFPLMVDYEERLYAAGKISGSRFIKREGRPSDRAILTARLVDRPLRPLFPKEFRNDVQVIVTVLSYDREHEPDIIAINAASAALALSGAPFNGPVGAARVGLIDGKLVVNPSGSQMDQSTLNIVVAGTADKVMMLEADATEVPEATVLEAITLAQKTIAQAVTVQTKLAEGTEKMTFDGVDEAMVKAVSDAIGTKLTKALAIADADERKDTIAALETELFEALTETYGKLNLKTAFEKLVDKGVREAILTKDHRPDGRKLDEIRPLKVEAGLLPRTHGSGFFGRGETQVITIATLGAPGDEQMIDTMEEDTTKRYLHHYNFPPFSVGEVKPMRSPGRREIGHGALAEKALRPVIPDREKFPYTVRLVSEVVSSNGSTSMAATCGSTIALMDAGVPIKAPVAGMSIGLVHGGGKNYKLLTDIAGAEDFSGDMDFKVTGTRAGITAIQLDIKIDGLTFEIVKEALARAKTGREVVLDAIAKVIAKPRPELSPYAPRIFTMHISTEKIGEIIGPGGKTIRKLIEDCGGKEVISIDIEDDGTVLVASADKEAAEKAIAQIEAMTREVRVGEMFTAPVVDIVRSRQTGQDVGAVVQILPKTDGMIHISELADHRVAKVTDVVKVGDVVTVKVVAVDPIKGRISLSMKQV